MRTFARHAVVVAFAFALLACGASAAPAASAASGAPLLADRDRDGKVTASDAEATTPALVLANVDDDGGRCHAVFARPAAAGAAPDAPRFARRAETAKALARCVDAGDDRVNGTADARDLAPLAVAPQPTVADGASATLTVSGAGRLFLRTGDRWRRGTTRIRLTAAQLRRGVRVGVEARDVARVPGRGARLTVRLAVRRAGAAAANRGGAVPFAVAPLLAASNVQAPQRLLVRKPLTETKLSRFLSGQGTLIRRIQTRANDAQRTHVAAVRDALRRGGSAVPVEPVDDRSPWTQDGFEAMTAAVPGPDGPHAMRVLLRASDNAGLEADGRFLFTTLLGRDVGVVQVVSRSRDRAGNSYNGTGDVELLPPHPGHPLGRVLIGAGVEPAFRDLIAAQREQPALEIDTSWLAVGHVDETLAVLPAATPRGWVLAVADPRRALALLGGVGDQGLSLLDGAQAIGDDGATGPARAMTVADVLAPGSEVRAASERAAAAIDRQLAAVQAATGLGDGEVVRLPQLFSGVSAGPGAAKPTALRGLAAYTGAMVNGVALDGRRFLMPAAHGPRAGGVDVLQDDAVRALAAVGVTAVPLETFPFPHSGGGEVHCTTNMLRAPLMPAWWRTG